MEVLATNEKAFIRPSPAGDSLGGVARKTRESIILCEAAGFDVVLIETVGVGQSELAVHSMVDFFLLLLLPGAGDELQGIKRGIVEMADLIVVNKADGDRLKLAKQSKRAYQNALHLFPPKASQWSTKVKTCSALSGQGIEELWANILEFKEATLKSGFFKQHRKEQAIYWLHESIRAKLNTMFYGHTDVQQQLKTIEEAILEGKMSSFKGAELLMDLFKNRT